MVDVGDDIQAVTDQLDAVIGHFTGRLTQCGALGKTQTVATLTKYRLLMLKKALQGNPNRGTRAPPGVVDRDFNSTISLIHCRDLLSKHGLHPMFLALREYIEGNKNTRLKAELLRMPPAMELYQGLKRRFDPPVTPGQNPMGPHQQSLQQRQEQPPARRDDDGITARGGTGTGAAVGTGAVGGNDHPKLVKLEAIILQHFDSAEDPARTRVMVFSQFRDSVNEITEALARHEPIIRARSFVGQSNGKGKEGGKGDCNLASVHC